MDLNFETVIKIAGWLAIIAIDRTIDTGARSQF
jgi:hypothetical protein